ncbi:MAG: Nif3-like dinuclear metal center hexameric protein [Prevotellaceae bacterium]|jgi:dinuclear metal center YbgI/SA1388 family protein|nr:Nif3-like dinuclear metal center hexameric protein [Prevotellaceae bacterium]
MKHQEIIAAIEEVAPLVWQEPYDNAGWQVGNPDGEAKAALLCIDVTESVIDEAIRRGCNLIICHHPLIFGGLKNVTPQDATGRCVIQAVKNDMAIYAAHTNLDNVSEGVNAKIAEKIGLQNGRILQPKTIDGQIGAGWIGTLPQAETEESFLARLKNIFHLQMIRYTPLLNKKIKTVALCGGAGSFLLGDAIAQKADVFLSGDFKYHDFFKAENRILTVDTGHFELEQYTKEIFFDIIRKKFPTFALYFSETKTNPINYF